ncbi:slipin family protein [Paenibacillus sp. 1011MAR3C5]|uniref:slipin family protein n=1 Tax=Paenibacillus sp. 1011MAR3C5 TaxID=1675787 RepID=UPI000E6C0EAA|nr:slipin family protein [Paenibacillus sp. 1011MAR3C5]RJE84394.1 slipin family protein [Paenibacillus sp. 1011MAR3C5]
MKKWIETTIVKSDERGLLFHKGSYKHSLKPGTYRNSAWSGNEIVVMDVSKPFAVHGKELALFRQDAELAQELTFVDVQDLEYVLHYEDGRFVSVLGAGSYAYWNVLKEHRFMRIDIREPELPSELASSIPLRLMPYCTVFEVASHERGMLHYNQVFQRELAPGKYVFWKNGPVGVQVKLVDLRQQQLDLTGQEMMTEDKITLRLNFVCQYQIVSPIRTLEIRGFDEQVYITLQLILREYVGTMKLDDLLRVKQEIGGYVLNRLNEHSDRFGVRFASAGVKDIILPGEVKDILNTVLLAEKRAQANLIMRREETASTRSLLNTAKLMEESGTLYRLKELEYLEKICDRVGSISLTGGGNLLEQLNALVGAKKAGDHS